MAELKQIKSRLRSMTREAQEWIPHWTELSKNIKPTRGWFDNNKPNKARVINHKIMLDSRPSRAARSLAAGMTSGLVSPARPWFRLGLADRDLMRFQPVKEWLADVRDRMLSVFAGSNFYGVIHSNFEELGVFGTGPIFIGEDFKDTIRCRNFTAGSYVIGTGHDGRVNAFGRNYQMTIGQMVGEFGKENVSPDVLRLFKDGKVDQWRKVSHLIEENDDRIEGFEDFDNMPYRSVQWEEAGDTERQLRAGGFEEFPVMAPRWELVVPSDIYGHGPGSEGVGDSKMLQKMQRDKLLLLDKLANPPVQKDASIDGEVNTLPGGVTTSSSDHPDAGVRVTYQVDPKLEELRLTINETKRDIDEIFYVDLWKAIISDVRKQPRTATEIVEKHEEKLILLGPVLERTESELLDPAISRTFGIMLRTGQIPPPPEELQGKNLTPEYISLLAQAQKMVGTVSLQEHVQFVGDMAALDPTVMDTIDLDAASRAHGEMKGVAPDVIRAGEEVDAIRDARAKAADAAAQAESVERAAGVAKTLGDTKVGEGNALEAITGTPPATPPGNA